MRTRIIQTKFWSDEYVAKLTVSQRLFFLYCLTNQYVNLIWFYECSDRIIRFETGIDDATLQEAKLKFQKDKKILFLNDYIFLVNASKYENFTGQKNEVAAQKLWDLIPESVKVLKDSILDTPIDTPIDTPLIGTISHKSEIINHKSIIYTKKIFQKLQNEILKEAKSKYPDKDVNLVMEEFLEGIEIKDYHYKNYKLAFFKWVRGSYHNSHGGIKPNGAVQAEKGKYDHIKPTVILT